MKNDLKFVIVTQRVDYIQSRKEKRDSVDQKLIDWLISNDFVPLPMPNYLLSEHHVDLILSEMIDKFLPHGIILSGGNNVGECLERDKLERSLLKISIRKKIPALGICRGFQFMNSFLSGTLTDTKNHVGTQHPLKIESDDHGDWPNEVNSYHSVRIKQLAKDFIPICLANDQTIEAAISFTLPWEGWMWHPERNNPYDHICKQRLRNLFNFRE